VDDLLDVSRITRGLVELRQEPVNLAEVADQAVEMAAPVVEGRRHDLNLSLPRKPLRVEGDATRLTQVIDNLLGNALRHTPVTADVTVRVATTTSGPAPSVLLEVADEGPGMSEEDAARAFERFYRADASRSRADGSTGLGLAIVAAIVDGHHGTVEATSTPGDTRFTVRLPLRPR